MAARILGRTGLSVSRLGLGLAALGRPGYINLGHANDLNGDYAPDAMRSHAHAVLDAAWELGIRYFDAARSYGQAESFLASWLNSRNIGPELVVVGSKWGYTYTAGWKVTADKHEVKDHSLPVLVRQIRESKALLGPYLNLYQIHSATLESGVFDNREVHEELARLRAGGLKVGLTITGARQAEALGRALEVTVGGERLFDCVQATWNLLEPSAGPALAEAHKAGLGVIVKEPLANGRLTIRNTDPGFVGKLRMLEDTASRLQTTVDALALAAAMSQPWADVVLSGAATVEHIASNAASQEVPWNDTLAEKLRALVEVPEEYWSTRGQLAWG